MDDLSFALAISLQLEDIQKAIASRKGKGRLGDAIASSDEVALNNYREHLEAEAQILKDERLAQSLDKAVRADALLLLELTQVELNDEGDRELAIRLAEDPSEVSAIKNHKWRDMAVGSRVEVTDSAIEGWEQKCLEWDHLESKETGGPSTSLATRGKRKNCVICMESFSIDLIIDAPCTHAYCHACTKQLFLNACKDEQLFPPRCCRQEIPLEIAIHLLSDEQASEFLDKSEEFTTSNRTYCFQPSCSKFIPTVDITFDIGTCSSCLAETCTLCKKERHDGDCPEDSSLKLTLAIAAENGWQRCQKCHGLVELTYGCQHMTCRCKAEWCYRCGVEWKNCECNDWDVGRLRRRAEDLAIREVGRNANPQVLAVRTQAIEEDLEQSHECEHLSGWRFTQGAASCEMCSNFLPHYIFVCKGCRLRACNNCRKNRI